MHLHHAAGQTAKTYAPSEENCISSLAGEFDRYFAGLDPGQMHFRFRPETMFVWPERRRPCTD